MDAAAYLKKQGWRGTGHSLDHTDRGIVRPLQISKKVDALGVGIQKYAAVSDQWWLRAYDQGLKDLGKGKESALATAQKHGVNRGGLYARFVKGKDIPGTIGERVEPESQEDSTSAAAEDEALGQVKTKGKKSKDSKRKALDHGTLVVDLRTISSKKRRQADSAVTTGPDTDTDSTRQQTNVKKQIRAYVDEAIRRGILPADPSGGTTRRTNSAPSEQDMTAVLRLAKLDKAKKQESQAVAREKLMRNLKRAACKYLESQLQGAPT